MGKKRKVDEVVEGINDDDFVEEEKKVPRKKKVSNVKKARPDEVGSEDEFQEEMARESRKKKVVKKARGDEGGSEGDFQEEMARESPKKKDKEVETKVERTPCEKKISHKVGTNSSGVNLQMNVKRLFSLFETLETNMKGMEKNIRTKINDLKGDVEKKMNSLEKQAPVNPRSDDGAQSKHAVKQAVDDGAESERRSWMIMTKASSQDGTPVEFVVNTKRHTEPTWDDVVDVTTQVMKAECEMRKVNSDDTLYVSYERGRLDNLMGRTKVIVKLVEDNLGGAAAKPRNNELEKSKCRHKDAQETHVGEERNVTMTIIKPSVKKAEELFIEDEMKKQRENVEAGQVSDSKLEGRRRKNHRRKTKTRKNNFDSFNQINTLETEELEVHRRNKKHHGFARSIDIDNMIKDFYSQIHRRSTSRLKNGMVNNKQEDYKEKLRELVKFLISQKLLHGNRPRENSEILTSKDLMEVFQILGSDEELFLKLLQDPEILVSRDIQCQKGEESLNLSEINEASEQSSLADTMWSNFFRTKDSTPQEVNNDKDCVASDRIFILNPRSASFSSSDIGNNRCSSPDSHLVRNKLQSEINSSHFFLSEIKKKLKQAIKKDQPVLQREGFPKNVPTKDHLFIERMTKPSTSQKRSHNV
ncbi:unnamed protein product [Cochlearia groenlandica]